MAAASPSARVWSVGGTSSGLMVEQAAAGASNNAESNSRTGSGSSSSAAGDCTFEQLLDACQGAVTAHPHMVPLGAAVVLPSAGVTAVVTQPAVVPGEVPGCHSGASLLTVLQQRPLDLGSDLQRRWLLYQVLQVRHKGRKYRGGEGQQVAGDTRRKPTAISCMSAKHHVRNQQP